MAKQLSRMTIPQLRAEIARRQTGLPKLEKKRAQLLKAMGAIDRQIAALGGQVGQPAKPKGKPTKVTTPKAPSGKPLVQCIKDVLDRSKAGMRVKNIMVAVQKAGYKTTSKNFYHTVATTVRGDEFKKLGWGIYTLNTGNVAVKKAKKVRKAGAKKAAAPKASSKRKKYAQTAEQFVLGLVKGKGAISSDINKAWKAAGRTGRADNTLNKMLKGAKLKRQKIKGAKGSTYTAG